MKLKTAVMLLAMLFVLPAVAQDMTNINFYAELGDRPVATVGDAVKLFALTMGQKPRDFNTGKQYLVKEGVFPDKSYAESDPLRRRTAAYMAARYLKLGDSLMYSMFKNERYAVVACGANGIMPADKSEWDVLSGAELMEIVARVAERAGAEK
ncbi:MAG: hypothetical protein KBA15_01465 [Spirochaetes bacterium]|jgi:hypothetical protein|nr:hypothetical protein [Spirochaetota bacterium]